MSGPFGDWFDQQFPVTPGALADKTDEELAEMLEAGLLAANEQAVRRLRRDQQRAALYAWQAAAKLNPACTP